MATLVHEPRTAPQAHLHDVSQVRLCLAALVVVAAVTALHVAHVHPTAGTLAVVGLVVMTAPGLAVRHGLALAGVGWAWITGFLVNTGGQLSLSRYDLARMAVLLLVALAAGVPRRHRDGVASTATRG